MLDLTALRTIVEHDPRWATEQPSPQPAPQVDEKCRPGDIWALGEHRLMCGDSTSAADVARLMHGAKADLVFTSPPYDKQRDYTQPIGDWLVLMQGVFGNLPAHNKTQVLVNLGLVHNKGEWYPYWDPWIEWMRAQGWRRFGWYVWDKLDGLPILPKLGRPYSAHEFVFHFNTEQVTPNKTVKSKWGGTEYHGAGLRNAKAERAEALDNRGKAVQERRIMDSVIRVSPEKGNRTGHPAVFPVALPEAIHAAYSQPGEIVYEPFAGSGTSIIAAERGERRCYAMEIAPEYCDIAIRRYEKETGKKPVRA